MGRHFGGKLDGVRIWNIVRTVDEIRANYRQELTVTQPGLAANWRFDEGSDLSAVNLVAEHDAVLTGGAQYSSSIHP